MGSPVHDDSGNTLTAKKIIEAAMRTGMGVGSLQMPGTYASVDIDLTQGEVPSGQGGVSRRRDVAMGPGLNNLMREHQGLPLEPRVPADDDVVKSTRDEGQLGGVTLRWYAGLALKRPTNIIAFDNIA